MADIISHDIIRNIGKKEGKSPLTALFEKGGRSNNSLSPGGEGKGEGGFSGVRQLEGGF